MAALGGKALLQRSALDALAELARHHDVVVTAGGAAAGGLLEQELANRLSGRTAVTVLIQVVDDPESGPVEVVELPAIKILVDAGAVVVCTGGGIERDLAAELLALGLGADDLLLLTDVPAVQLEWGTPEARTIHRATPQELRGHAFAAETMGSKIEAACRFVEQTGGTAAIGALHDAAQILDGNAGTIVRRDLY